MFVGEDQAQLWMKTANWEYPKRPLGLQLQNQTTHLHDPVWAITKCWEITKTSPKSVHWNTIQDCSQKSEWAYL